MTKILNINNPKFFSHPPKKYDRLPNVSLGRNARVITNNALIENPSLNKYINDNTMGALDNYAAHENLDIFIAPLEDDSLKISVFKDMGSDNTNFSKEFSIKINEGKEGYTKFFKDLYTKVAAISNLRKK